MKEISSREIEVLTLAAEGYSDDRIARQLCISRHTAYNHMHNIITKLNVSNRTYAVVLALRIGYLSIELTERRDMKKLSPRETEILTLVAEGYSYKQVAGLLSCGQQTITNHMSNVLKKLDANDGTHAVILALRAEYLPMSLVEVIK